jgi:multiple sugar transport system substrate-binding protein
VRKTIILILALLLVLGIASVTAQKITVTAAMMAGDIPQETQDFLDVFAKENPDVQIDFTNVPQDLEVYLQPKAASGQMPDFISVNGGSFGADLVDRGILVDLKDTFAAKNTVDAVKPQFTSPKGRLFGIAGGVSTSLIYYNVQVFKDLGLTIPDNWEDFLVVCEKIKQAGKVPLIITPGDGTMSNTLWSHGFANNVASKYPDYAKRLREGTMNLDTPEFADVYAKGKLLFDKGYTQPGAVSTKYMPGNQMYIQGEAVMHFAGSWLAGSLLKTDFETGVFMPPWNSKGKTRIPIVATETGWGVSEGPHKKQAIRLLDWINGKGYHYYQNARGNIPHVKDPMGPVKLDDRIKNYLTKLYSYKQTAGLWFEYIPAETMTLTFQLYQEVLTSQKTPREAAAAFDKAARDAVKK